MSATNLFKPIKLGHVQLKNRLVYAPTTRIRCDEDGVPTDSMLEYYKQRATDNGGLLIVEATAPHPSMGIMPYSPILYTERQVKAFKKIVEAVHEQGSSIGIQFWDIGRASNPALLKKAGYPFHGPSSIYWSEESEKNAKAANNELREMTIDDIRDTVKKFAEGTKRAVEECGFDFVEIHGAHGYLIDSFLQTSANHRTDQYGGSIENRARLALEVVDACIEAVGSDHVGIRISPYAVFQGSEGMHAKLNPIVTWGYLLSELQRRADDGKPLAYISVVEPRVSANVDNEEAKDVDMSWVEMIWKGPIITAGNFLGPDQYKKLPEAVNRDDRTLIAIGRFYTSNPDLVDRLKNGYELTHYNRPTFYIPCTNLGYLNYGKYGEEEDHSLDTVKPVALA